jgi:hypothetical protein
LTKKRELLSIDKIKLNKKNINFLLFLFSPSLRNIGAMI